MSSPIYATTTDLVNYGLPASVLAATTNAQQVAILNGRSRWIDSFLRAQFELPLVTWDTDITQAVCAAASYDLMVIRGYNPEAGADINIRLRFEDARKWAEDCAAGKLTPSVTDSSPDAAQGTANQGITSAGPRVSSATQRGYSSRATQPGAIPGSFEGD